jgi:RHS repeat-associated protein
VTLGASSLSRAYDRAGNVVSDGRSFAGVSGDAGSGSATYAYDGLGRVTAASGLSRTDAYTYDRNGNRLTAAEGGTTVSYTYDRADQLIEQTIGGVDTGFAYNTWGDLTAAADRDNGVTTHAYDAGGRMISLTPPGATAAAYTYDALGRPASRTIGAAGLTYQYVGVGNLSYAAIPGAGSATYGLIDATSNRLAVNTGGVTAWSLFDLHGNFAGASASGSSTIVNAVRYDAYGATLDAYSAGSGSTATPWRYQGRLDLSPDADEPLYDYGARRYRPSAGAFTQLDTYAGTVQNPLSMNRYLYAHANPTTLIDPTGRCVVVLCIDGHIANPTQGTNAAVTQTAAQQQVAASSSWAPQSATNTANTASQMAQAAQQVKAKALGPTTAYHWQGVRSVRTTFASPRVYIPNPSNLPWVGSGATGSPPPGRFGAMFAAIDAAPERSPYPGVHPMDAAMAGALVIGGGSLVILVARAGFAAASSGLGTACMQYCDDAAAALEGFAGAPPRLPSSSSASEGIELNLRYREGWTSAQRAAADMKVAALNRPTTTTRTDTPVSSGSDSYAYDDNHNRTQVAEDNGDASSDLRYCYDARDQLVYRQSGSACSSGSNDEAWTYDSAGNRLTAPSGGVTTNFAYDGDGLLCDVEVGSAASCSGGNVSHDSAGRIESWNGWTFAYDAEGRLVSACKSSTCASGYDKLAFTYDGEGHRTSIVATDAASTVTTTEFRYAGDAVVEESVNGTVARRFVTDESGAISKLIIPSGANAGTYLVTWNGHGDALNLLRVKSDGTTELANSFTYSTWGTPTVDGTHPNSAHANTAYGDLGFRYLYVGQFDVQWDNTFGLGLHYMHARHYAADLGRFMQPDPEALERDVYGYAWNNPTSRIDPEGEFAFVAVAFLAMRVASAVIAAAPVVHRIATTAPRITPNLNTQITQLNHIISRHTWDHAPRGASVFLRGLRWENLIQYGGYGAYERVSRFTNGNWTVVNTVRFNQVIGYEAVRSSTGQWWYGATDVITFVWRNGMLWTMHPGYPR